MDAIRAAFELADEAHAGQRRASGEPFVSHAVEVAVILAHLQLDTASIVSALVHDVVEDTVVSLHGIRELFGDQVAAIVDGVTKIGQVQVESKTERQVENYRKLLLFMARDARVILVKLADRLHNMRTLHYLPPGKQQPIAHETRQIYAPLAHRLGMAAVKWELEDLCFKHLEPDAYQKLRKLVRQRRRERERHILRMQRPLQELLKAEGLQAEVTGRPKHLWSIHRKMVTQYRDYDDIYDIMAFRVITRTVGDCYVALGAIHGRWTPIPERFHDYVGNPKSNLYQSIHTTISGPEGGRYEIQIRTHEMHQTAEHGIAAHWRYKEGGRKSPRITAENPAEEKAEEDKTEEERELDFFTEVVEWMQDARDADEFMESLNSDLYHGEIFVFTPRGDVKKLPVGSTPIDFAFSVHTEVGLHCAGAKVNGRIAPLSHRLRSGDSIKIITKPGQRPNRDWLGFVKTSRARTKIRQWIRRKEYESALRLGQEFFERELRKARRPKPSDDEMATGAGKLGYDSFDDVLAALASGKVSPAAVIRGLYPDEDPAEVVNRSPSALERIAAKIRKSNRGIAIQGVDNLMVRYSKCCQPVPGDDVIGHITRGRGISIHRSDCPNVLALDKDPGRRVEIEWRAERDDRFFVHLYMEGTDRRGLLGDVGRTISETATNIQHGDMRGTGGGMVASFVVEVQDLKHLNRVMQAVRRVKGVTKVVRRETFGEEELKAGRG